ncbi:MAG: hypothetical protein ACRD3F_02085, partial [Acidobacteriaceae bacterium]
MKRVLAGFSLAVVMMLPACVPAMAQDSGPQLTLTTANGQTTFRIGERIPLELVFTGPSNGRYQVEMGSEERRPGFTFEDVKVSPEGGWADPLKIYIESLMGYGGDYLSSDVRLSAKPEVIPMDLNEWVRFDEPGRYQVVVTTRRVADLTARRAVMPPQSGLVLTSSPIEIQIVQATAAWQKAKLAEIESALAKPVKKNDPPSPGQQTAMADLL